MTLILPILHSLRPLNLLLIFVFQLVIFLFGGGHGAVGFTFFLTFPVLLVAAGGYLVNNFCDQKKDAFNQKENRPKLAVKPFLFIYFGFNLLALGISLIYSIELFLVVSIVIFLLFLYAKCLSDWPLVGNFLVSLLSAFSVGIIYFFPIDNNWEMSHLYFLIILIFNVSLVRELVKDCEDMDGDKKAGAQTVPISFGLNFSNILIALILFINSIFTGAWGFYFLSIGSAYFWLIVVLASLGLAIACSIFLLKSEKKYRILSNVLKVYMFLGVFLIPALR